MSRIYLLSVFIDAVLEIGKGVENFQAMFESDKANRTMSEKMFNYLTSVNLFYYDFTDKVGLVQG